ncbi:MAG: ATP-binding protein [Bacteroidota bacterium]
MKGKNNNTDIYIDDVTERYLALYDRSSECIFLIDTSGNFIEANKTFLTLTGYTLPELQDLNISDIVIYNTDNFLEDLKSEIYYNKFEDTENLARQVELRVKSGNVIYVEIRSSFLEHDGEPYAIQTLARNITQQKMEEKTQKCLFKISESVNSTRDLNELFSSVHRIIGGLMPAENFYISLYDPVGDVLTFPYWVDEFDKMPPGERHPGRGLTEYVLRTGQDLLIDESLDAKLRAQGEIELIGEPSKIWLGVALKLMDRTIGVMVLQDYHNEKAYGEKEKQILIFVSEQIALAIDKKRAEEELRRYTEEVQFSRDMLEERAAEFVRLNEQLAASEDELKDLNASKDKFFSIIAHDLRSPFSGLLGFSNMLLDDFDKLSKEEIKNFTIHINSYTKNLYNLTENLLQWSRLQTGKLDYQPIRVDLHDMVADALNILMANALKKSITLENSVPEDTLVWGDQNMLRSVIQNLVSNAIKFTNTEGTVAISCFESNEFYEIWVKDNGIGIRTEDQDKIFRIDTTHSTLGTAQEKGTGLGLILCRDLITKHGGNIWLESEPGEGSTFKFTLQKFR